MEVKAKLESVYTQSEDVVSREVAGELLIVPLTAGIGDMEDELFTLNETGKTIWSRLDGQANLRDVVDELAKAFDASAGEIEEDVTGFVEELLRRGMLVEVASF